MSTGRIHRLLQLITELQSGTNKTAADLADQLGVSRRTLFRDLATLKEAGVPYYHESESGYRIDPSFFLPPVNLKVTEAMGLMLMGKAATPHKDQPFYRPAIEAINKMACLLPAKYRDVTIDMLEHVSVSPGVRHAETGDQNRFGVLQRAIEEGHVCRMRYHSLFDRADIDVVVEPYHLHHAVRAWYLIGRDQEKGEIRIYKLARIIDLELTGRRFEMNGVFDVERFLGNAWSLIAGEGTWEVRLEFAPKVGENVSEVLWHKSQRHELLEDGRCLVEFTVDGLDEIAWWLLGYGDQVRVLEPVELREKLRDVYRRALEQMEGEG